MAQSRRLVQREGQTMSVMCTDKGTDASRRRWAGAESVKKSCSMEDTARGAGGLLGGVRRKAARAGAVSAGV